jgi:protoporphyrin/coproporphyrin ferrochelatase
MRSILIVNLGTPASTETKDVRTYLRQFLLDERVIDYPAWARWLIVTLFVLPFRPKKTAAKYKTVWMPEGSPLYVYAQRVQKGLRERLGCIVEVGMRYGEPSVENALKKLLAAGTTEVVVVPLYPHYAMSTWETVAVEWQDALRKLAPNLRYSYLHPFYNDPEYLDVLAQVAREALDRAPARPDHLQISFHGVPERHIFKGDCSRAHCLKVNDCCRQATPIHAVCYKAQCVQSADALAQRLGYGPDNYTISFQSRFGPDKWIEPATDDTAKALASKGVKHLAIIAPAFVADCLETLEELCEEVQEEFKHAGGQEFTYLPCLNDHPLWIDYLARKLRPS